MSWFVTYVRSSIGAKHIMAVTGLLLALFAVQHMVGHFVMFGGRDAYNDYAHFLQHLAHGGLKWVARAGLLGILALHIGAGIRVSSMNRAARPVAYAVFRTARTKPWARTMVWSGLLILAFIVYHILHFTAGQIQPEYFHQLDPQGRYDAYVMFVRGFQNPAILGSYLVGMTLLLPHLAHGLSSLFQSLGLQHPKYDGLIHKGGTGLAVVLYLGYITPPLCVALGVIKLPGA